MNDRPEVASRRRGVNTGNWLVGLATLSYLVSFVLPWFLAPAMFGEGQDVYPGWQMFLFSAIAITALPNALFLAWLANPLLWAALVHHVVRRRRHAGSGWWVPAVLAALAAVSATVGMKPALVLSGEYEALIGAYVWVVSIDVAAAGLAIVSTE